MVNTGAFTPKGRGSIPGQGTRIPQARGYRQQQQKKNTKKSKVTTSESLETGMCVTVCYSHKTAFDNDDL